MPTTPDILADSASVTAVADRLMCLPADDVATIMSALDCEGFRAAAVALVIANKVMKAYPALVQTGE